MRDPEQSLQIALRSTRLLGIISASFGIVIIVAFGYFNRSRRFGPIFIALGAVAWFLPGVLLVTCWHYLRRRSRVALRLAMALVALQMILASTMFTLNFFLSPISIVPIVMTLIWALAAAQLLLRLWRARPAVDFDAEHHPGFTTQVVPLASRAEEGER